MPLSSKSSILAKSLIIFTYQEDIDSVVAQLTQVIAANILQSSPACRMCRSVHERCSGNRIQPPFAGLWVVMVTTVVSRVEHTTK